METNNEIRYCKNCKCELPSTNNDGLCGNCRDTNNSKKAKKALTGSILGSVLGLIGTVAIRAFLKNKKSK